jgi:hypothetical protein
MRVRVENICSFRLVMFSIRLFYGFLVTEKDLERYLHGTHEISVDNDEWDEEEEMSDDSSSYSSSSFDMFNCDKCCSVDLPEHWNVPDYIERILVDFEGTESKGAEVIIGIDLCWKMGGSYTGCKRLGPLQMYTEEFWDFVEKDSCIKDLMGKFGYTDAVPGMIVHAQSYSQSLSFL